MPPKNNVLPLWGNESSMNLNPLILTNIQSSPYFKNDLFKLKTYHEVIDEIYYKVTHLEPWERGSRQTSGQIGMCGGSPCLSSVYFANSKAYYDWVRGVGAGGIVSSAYCLLYKLYTLKLTRKQVNGLLTHSDSPFIRGLGFMYIRYTQPPQDLWDWYEEYLEDEEEIDGKAGGGGAMTIGEMLRSYLTKLEWYSTLFPRIPVPIMKDIERKMTQWRAKHLKAALEAKAAEEATKAAEQAERHASRERAIPRRTPSPSRNRPSQRPSRTPSPSRNRPSQSKDQGDRRRRSRSRERKRSRSRDRGERKKERKRSRSRERKRRSRSRERNHHRDRKEKRSRSRDRRRSRSKERRPRSDRDRGGDDDFARALQRERDRQQRERRDRDKRSRSKERKHRSRSRSREASHRSSRDR